MHFNENTRLTLLYLILPISVRQYASVSPSFETWTLHSRLRCLRDYALLLSGVGVYMPVIRLFFSHVCIPRAAIPGGHLRSILHLTSLKGPECKVYSGMIWCETHTTCVKSRKCLKLPHTTSAGYNIQNYTSKPTAFQS